MERCSNSKKFISIVFAIAVVFSTIFGNNVWAMEQSTPETSTQESSQQNEANTTEQVPNTEQGVNTEVVEQPSVVGQTVIDFGGDKAVVEQEITSWKWVDPDQVLTGSKLIIPNASADHILTREALEAMLPKAVLAMVNGSEVEVPLVWNYINYPTNGAYEGVYIVNALHKGYVLAKDVAPISVTVQFETNQMDLLPTAPKIAVDDPKFLVPGVSPFGTTIDLFDYWTRNKGGSVDPDNGDGNFDLGINAGHTLKFHKNTPNGVRYNTWTGHLGDLKNDGGHPLFGLVNYNLQNGYPKLYSSNSNGIASNKAESLSYLFNRQSFDGKKSYPNIKNLLQIDGEGYYYFNSKKNFAEYDDTTKSFKLYHKPAVAQAGQSTFGQFFPFNKGSDAFNINRDGELDNGDSTNAVDSRYNHFFGMKMSTRFVHEKDGYVNGDKNKPVTYEFSGDDDVWVFIDGVLVGDLGGIHNASSLSINFATGEVETYSINTQNQKKTYNTTNLRDLYKRAGKTLGTYFDEVKNWWGTSYKKMFKNDTFHQLDFFYLERGHTDSNMTLKFNLVTIPTSDVIKTDQLGEAVPGAEFTLYDASKNNGIYTKGNILATGITNEDGTFMLLNDKQQIISLRDLYNHSNVRHMILEETKVPDGYRKPKMSANLDLIQRNNKSIVVQCTNVYDSGIYASSKVLTKAPQTIKVYDGNQWISKDLNNSDPQKAGTMFAVVMKYMGPGSNVVSGNKTLASLQDKTNWYPVTGNEITGWHVEPGHSFTDILNAAVKNPYIFTKTGAGIYQSLIDNLPGNILNYYYLVEKGSNNSFNVNEVDYTVAYFWVPGKLTASTNPASIRRVQHEDPNNTNTFTRDFSTKLLVPNIANQVMVQKVNENGVPIKVKNENGVIDPSKQATFEIYDESQVRQINGKYVLNSNAQSSDLMKTTDYSKKDSYLDIDAIAHFPSSKATPFKLKTGVYYIKETKAPEGYLKNEELIQVIVNDSGVFVNAGRKDDGVRVKLGIGAVVKSLLQFTNGDVDATLSDVKVSVEKGSGLNSLVNTSHKFYTTYTKDNYNNTIPLKDLEYQLVERSKNCPNDTMHVDKFPGIVNDEGFADLKMKQWYNVEQDNTTQQTPNNKQHKTNLNDKDLTHLFSESVLVEVTNKKTDIIVEKQVIDSTLTQPSTREFNFNIELRSNVINPSDGTYFYEKTAQNGTVTRQPLYLISNQSGVYTYSFTLKDGEKICLQGLPVGTKYKIVESNPQGYRPEISVDNVTTNKEGSPFDSSLGENVVTGQILEPTTNSSDKTLQDYILIKNIKVQFTFTKVGKNTAGVLEELSGAKFVVYEQLCQHNHNNDLVDIKNVDACWKKVGTEVTSDINGIVTISGLNDNRTYRLIETKAPGGYVLPTGQWIFATDANGVVKKETIHNVGTTPAFEQEMESGKYKLHNLKPNELPLTGGRNHKLYAALGLAVMLLGMILTIKAYQRKNNSYDM